MEIPEDEEALVRLVRRAAAEGRTVRVVGAGHSSSSLVQTDDILVSLEKFTGLVSHDGEACEAVVRPGSTLHDMGQALLDVGLAVHNLGDVDVQRVAGAIATGTHGTGKTLRNLSAMLIGVRLVTGQGEVVACHVEDEPEFIQAARVSLGALGIFTELRLKLLPAYKLHRQEWCTNVEDCLAHLDELVAQNRNFDFYWYPRSDEAKLRILNEPGEGPEDIPYARLVEDKVNWAPDIISKVRTLRFDEMEYSLPAGAGPECFAEIRRRVLARHRKTVGWRVLYRTVAPDDAYLSTAHGRDTVTISLHQNNSLHFWQYFKDIEPVFWHYGGRPHWGKKHTLRAQALRPLYPRWDDFLAARRRVDPEGRFLNGHLCTLLGLEEKEAA
jgi:FAD/FMN-containing dehydrogenase